ncbi:MAG TPA: DUF5050 domain-containing protein [Clostridiaceae bacterium]|jgi:hypothetical protein|nr:DUF5050 domain-containing protein [Clostridiaceae bacterium]
MRCPNCGKKLDKKVDIKKCSYCGTKMKWKEPWDLTTIILLCITIVLFVVFLYVVYDRFLEDKIKDKYDKDPIVKTTPSYSDDNFDTGNTMGNLQNGGLVAETDDYVYYLAINKKKNMTFMRRSKTDETDVKKIAEGNIRYISVMKDAIYFTDKENHLSTIALSGSKKDLVQKVAIETTYNYTLAVGDWIYYCDEQFKLHRIRPNGSKNTALSEGKFKRIQAAEDMIYGLNESGNIVYIKGNGDNETVTDVKANEFVVYNKDWIYFLDDDAIYMASTEDFSTEKVKEIKASCLNIFEDKIYYFDKDAGKVFSMDIDGENVEEIVEFNTSAIFVTKSSLFLKSAEDDLIYEYKFGEDDEPKLVA